MRWAHIQALLVFATLALTGGSGQGSEPSSAIWAPAKPQKLLTPDARHFLAPPALAYWAGTERIFDGELSLAAPRAPAGNGFLPPLDDHLSTTTYLRAATAAGRTGGDANVLELSSLHDVRGGAVLGVGFRFDARARGAGQAVQGDASLALPLPVRARLWIVPTIGVGANTDFAPHALAGAELRSDRSKSLAYSVGVEASSWTLDRARALGTIGALYRIDRAVAVEERVSLGAWAGPRVGGELALRWTTAGLQTLGERSALYERVTLSRGPVAQADSSPPDRSAFSVDLAVGFRRTLVSSYGVIVQLDEGGQEGTYLRWGGELTLYGTLF
jgi:hypothetical protein